MMNLGSETVEDLTLALQYYIDNKGSEFVLSKRSRLQALLWRLKRSRKNLGA